MLQRCGECGVYSNGDWCSYCGSLLHPDHQRQVRYALFTVWALELEEKLRDEKEDTMLL